MIPCELVVKKVLPSIRRHFVLAMRKKCKNDAEIARRLGLSKAAISHYLGKKRGQKILGSRLEAEISRIVTGHLAAGRADSENFDKIACSVCKEIRKKRLLCEIHSSSAYSKNSLHCKNCLSACN